MKSHAPWMVIVGLAIVIAGVTPESSQATIFGQVSTAYTLEPGASDIGGFVSVFESSTLVFGQYRRGLFANSDLGIQGGFVDPEFGDMGVALGADLKFLLMKTGGDTPFDLALAPRFSYFNLDAFTVASFGGSVVISRDYAVEQGSIAPYGAFNMRIESISLNDPDIADDSDTDLEMSGIAGIRWDVSQLLDILGEVVFDRDIGFTMGLNFKL